MRHSSQVELGPRGCETNPSSEYLVQYEIAHEQLLEAMSEMAAVTNQPVFDKERLTVARWRIARASRARLELWDRVRDFLFQQIRAPKTEQLAKLIAENIEVREAASAIIARWPLESIEADWSGYCEAARQIRWKQMSIIRHERRDLLPILQARNAD